MMIMGMLLSVGVVAGDCLSDDGDNDDDDFDHNDHDNTDLMIVMMISTTSIQ